MSDLGLQAAISHLKLNDKPEQERWSDFGGICAAVKGSGSLGFELLLNLHTDLYLPGCLSYSLCPKLP